MGDNKFQAVIVTANLIEKNKKFLLVQEGHKYAYGLWNFPAGKVEENISLTDNAVKEAKEETGYKVNVKGLVGIYKKTKDKRGRNVIIFLFASAITGGKTRADYPDGEIMNAKWFSIGEIKKMKKDLRDTYMIGAIGDYRKRGLLPKAVNSRK